MRTFVLSASRGVYAFSSLRLEPQLRIQFRELRLMPIRVDRGRLACHIERFTCSGLRLQPTTSRFCLSCSSVRAPMIRLLTVAVAITSSRRIGLRYARSPRLPVPIPPRCRTGVRKKYLVRYRASSASDTPVRRDRVIPAVLPAQTSGG